MLKLATLPEPTLLLRPVPAFLQARLLQNILEQMLDEEAMQRFAELSGKRFLFRTFDDVVCLGMTFTDGSIRVQANPEWKADVTISGNLPALIALCFSLEDADSLFFSRCLLLTGDTASGLLFKNVLANLDFDLHAVLQDKLGARTADALWRMAGQAIAGIERADGDVTRTRTWLTKSLHLSTTDQTQSLRTDMNALAGQYDAMQHRMAKLEKKLARRA